MNVMKQLLSIIVPVYNVESYLQQCIESILSQSYRDIDLILVDDGSKDSSGAICDAYAEKDRRVHVIHKKNGGVADTRNTGLRHAAGEYVTFVDSDDFLAPDAYKTHMENLQKTGAQISICGFYSYYHPQKILPKRQDAFYAVLNSEQAIQMSTSFDYFGIAVWDKVFKKDLFEGIEFPAGRLAEDWFVVYKLLDRAQKIVYDARQFYYYRQRPGSYTHDKLVSRDNMLASKEVLDFVTEHYPNIREDALFSYVFACVGVYNNLILYNKKDKAGREQLYKIICKHYKRIARKCQLSKSRRCQLMLLRYCPPLYTLAFHIFDKKRRKELQYAN